MTGTAFPAFLSVTSDGKGFADFTKAADTAFSSVEQRMTRFKASGAEIGRVISDAMGAGTRGAGRLDLGTGQFKLMAAEARLAEESIRTVLAAASRLAQETGDTTQATQDYVTALRAEAAAATQARQAAEAKAQTYERLQSAVADAAAGNARLTAAFADVRGAQAAGMGVERYSSRLDELKASLDPAYYAQRRFDEEMGFAKVALANGDISAAQYASRLGTLTAELNQNAQTTKQQRFAYAQLGQQLQDVAIQAQMGVSPFVILTQQGSQAAYALSGLSGSASKVESAVGRFATFMSGPWGAAITLGIGVIGGLTTALLASKGASEDAADATKDHKRAIDDLIEAQTRATQSETDRMRQTYVSLEAERQQELQVRKTTQALLEKAQAEFQSARSSNFGAAGGAGAGMATALYAARTASLEAQLKANEARIEELTKAAGRARNTYLGGLVDAMATPEGRIQKRYEDQRNALLNGQSDDPAKTAAALKRLNEQRDAELKRLRDSEQALKGSTTARDGDAASLAQVQRLLIESLGATITSGKRSKAENAHIGGSPTSAHLTGQALDFVPKGGMGSISKDQIRAVMQAAGLTVKEILGPGDKGHNDHYHVAWSGGKGEMDTAKIAEQLAKEQQRIQDELDRSTASLISRYDSAKSATMEYSDALSEIDRLMNAGKISKDDAAAYRTAAGFSYADQQRQSRDKVLSEIAADLSGSLPEAQQAANLIADYIDQGATSAERINEAINDGADILSQFIGNDLTRLLYKAAQTGLGGQNSASRFLTGVKDGTKKFEDDLADKIAKTLDKVFGSDEFAKNFGEFVGQAIAGAKVGGSAGDAVVDILGIGNGSKASKTGGEVGKAVGAAIGTAVGGPVGAAIGSFIGTIQGTLLGSLFGKTPRASAVITSTSSPAKVTGTDRATQESVSGLSTGVQSSLNRIIEQFGGELGAFSVSIGQYKDYFRVSGSGSSQVGDKRFPNYAANDTLYDGQDANEAVRIAVLNAIQDGAVAGIREGSKRLLAASKDLDAGLSKALKFENAFKDLKKITDPVGAALDEVNLKFRQLRDVAIEAGASAEELAQIQQLYGEQRKDALKQVTDQLTGSLKSLLSDLTIGDSGLSIRSRLANAQAAYDPLRARVAAGDSSAYGEFSDAATTLLELQRQMFGSQDQYFALLDEITALTSNRLSAEEAKIKASNDNPSPFDVTPVVDATQKQTDALIGSMTPYLSSIAASNADLVGLLRSQQINPGDIQAIVDARVANF
jgi:uncharacterized protein YcbK (DUF882 family)